ncbi:MAG: tetratricopeptide repeat protein [Candidatus Binatus sp.]
MKRSKRHQPSKSTFAAVLKRAEEARILLSGKSTRERGMHEFDCLVSDHPKDGMIYFKRAEAHEALNDLRAAAADYREAQSLFPKPIWRDLAESRAERLGKDAKANNLKTIVSSSLGNPAGGELRHIADSVWQAGTFAEEMPFVSIELSRTGLVRAIKVLEDAPIHDRNSRPSWPQRLDAVSGAVPKDLVRRAKTVLRQRDTAVYDGTQVTSGHAQAAFGTVVEFLGATFGHPSK